MADANNGLNIKSFQYTLATEIDLIPAITKVEHISLLNTMDYLEIPSCFGKFYRSFLEGHCFRVCNNDILSKMARESCGSTQGTVPLHWYS